MIRNWVRHRTQLTAGQLGSRSSIKSGAIILLLLMLPNLAWMCFYRLDGGANGAVAPALSFAENAARFAVLALPFFYPLDLKRSGSKAVLIGMTIAGAVYYAAWLRFFVAGGAVALLSAPLWGMPAPLALAPVVFLLLSSYLMGSWWMFSAAFCFGVLHVWVLALGTP